MKNNFLTQNFVIGNMPPKSIRKPKGASYKQCGPTTHSRISIFTSNYLEIKILKSSNGNKP